MQIIFKIGLKSHNEGVFKLNSKVMTLKWLSAGEATKRYAAKKNKQAFLDKFLDKLSLVVWTKNIEKDFPDKFYLLVTPKSPCLKPIFLALLIRCLSIA